MISLERHYRRTTGRECAAAEPANQHFRWRHRVDLTIARSRIFSQLSYVPRPMVGQHLILKLSAPLVECSFLLRPDGDFKMCSMSNGRSSNQFAQRRKLNGDHVDPVVEIFTQSSTG